MKVLGIDVGGSAVKGAPVDTVTGRLLAKRVRVPTPEQLTPTQMARVVRIIAKEFKWKGPIGVGFPGVVRKGVIMTAANLDKRFVGCKGELLFRKATGSRVRVINDADAAGLAEMKFGAGRRAKGSVVLLTVGTGIGSVMFYNGVLFPNTEFGHVKHKGDSYEKFASSSVRERKDLSFKEWGGRVNKYLEELEGLIWPELIIIGGGVSAEHEKWFRYLKTKARVVPARFLNQAGIIGAALAGAEMKRW